MSEPLPPSEPSEQLRRLEARLARERSARKQAEALLEDKSRALYLANQALQQTADALEQRVAERTAELAAARQYLENIITHMGEALLVLEPGGTITMTNPAACRMLGYPEADLIGMPIGDIFEEEGDEQAGAFLGTWLEALIRTGALSKIEARFIARDGRRVPILFARTAVRNTAGAISDIICIAKDMTGYVRVEPGDDTDPATTYPCSVSHMPEEDR